MIDWINGVILGGVRVECNYTDRRWKWLGKLMFAGDVLTAGSKRAIADKSAAAAAMSAVTSFLEQSVRNGTGEPHE